METTARDVRGVLAAVVGHDAVDSLPADEPFFTRRIIDSLHLVETIDHFHDDLGIEVAGEDLSPENFGSIRGMARYLRDSFRADALLTWPVPPFLAALRSIARRGGAAWST